MQQEGDRAWLPLESPDVEILEGRYRVMVKNVAPNAVMDIRITHESTSEDPPKRRTQVRSGKSNPMGLVVVIPFTQMQPGTWELACVPNDLMSDLMGHQGQYSVQLHVLPKESDVAGEWEPDWSQPATIPTTPEPTTPEPVALPVPDDESPQPPILGASEILVPLQPPILGASETLVPPELGVRGPIVLTLQPDNYEIQAAQTVILQGMVQADRADLVPNCTFVVRVRDPQQGEVVVETSTPFTQIVLPFEMQLGVVLPETLPGQMLMGEVCLMDDASGDLLSRQTFTFFALLTDVLASIAQDLNPQIRPAAVDELPHPPAEPSGPEFDDQLLGLVNQPANPAANPLVSFQAQSSSQLPPKLYQPDPDRPERSAPSLPSFLKPPTPETNVEELFEEPEDLDQISSDDGDLDLSFDDLVDEPVAENLLDPVSEDQLLAEVPALGTQVPNEFEMTAAETAHLFDDGLDAALDADDRGELAVFNTTAPLDLDDPDDLKTIDINAQALPDRFELLNLGDRFMDRMSAFAEETHTESTNAVPPAPEAPINPFASVGGRSSSPEAVIMDELLPTIPVPGGVANGQSGLDLSDNPLLIPSDELVPTPSLEIEAVDEVVAGQSLAVKVKLPMIQPKLYVKLWINDRQTRTLLDGPRYLVDFIPDRLNQHLEATTQLTVPLGSLEIQIEAIAIETATKREGYKVSSALAVVPSNLPRIGVDDFGF